MPAPRDVMRPGWWTRAVATARLELAMQRREPATALYLLVFVLLTFGFVASGTVELVRDRGTLPKLSPLAIALALCGLTAFGQVITTMITASAILRDAAWRTDQLLFTTALEHRAWVLGRWAASLGVMVVVYAGLLIGVLLGAAAPWVARDVPWGTVLGRALWPWVTVTLPTTLTVATLLTAAAVRTRRLLGVLAAALTLLFLWQGCEALQRSAGDGADGRGGRRLVAALADPFGTVAVQVTTSGWSDDERATRLVPASGLVGASRLAWLAIAAVVGGLALRPGERPSGRSSARRSARPPRTPVAHCEPAAAGWRPAARSRLGAVAVVTARWTWRDTGWRVIAALGALNVFAHALAGEAAGAAGVLLLVREHARLFLILLATIYAGELLWRDADERVRDLVATTPVPTATLAGGRVLGLMAAQAGLVGALGGAAWLGLALRGRAPLTPGALGATLAGGVLWLWLPFVQWLVLSLAVHVAIRHKVMAHLALIAGWVVAVAFDANGATAWWLRFADPPALPAGEAFAYGEAAFRAAWWSAVSAGLFALTVLGWRRATARR